MAPKKFLKKSLPATLSVSIFGLTMTGCEAPSGVQAGNSAVSVVTPTQAPNDTSTNSSSGNAVCDPFGSSANQASRVNGLHAKLFSLPDSEPRYGYVQDYFDHGIEAPADLFFNQLNVPTRPFDQGFMTQNGTLLKTPSGDTLYEWFALKFKSEIRLSFRDQPGKYQFAVLADDGAKVLINDSGTGFRELINNDLTHPSRLGCSYETIRMDATTRIPLEVDYFQGPRYHISLILMWRKIDDSLDETKDPTILQDATCGVMGNDTFFNSYLNPPEAQPTWLGLLARGWNVLTPENYFLPDGVEENPCTNANGQCYTDHFYTPAWNTFTLSHSGIDQSTLKVTQDGASVAYRYDPVLNLVYVTGSGGSSAKEIKIDYCLQSTQPSPTPSASPSPTPTQTVPPVITPNPGTEPTSLPSCVGPSCGVLGV